MANQDNVKILGIDQTQISNGYVNVDTTITIASTPYPQTFTVSGTDIVSVASSVKSQAESFKAQVADTGAIVSGKTDLNSLVNTTIAL